MKMVQMPKWVAVCLALSALASLCLAALALTSYTLVKPFTLTITTAPCPLSVESVSFAYNPDLNRWTACNVQVNNTQTSPVTATVFVYLKNATATIAQGQQTHTFPPNAITLVTVTLSWIDGTTSADVTGGYIVLQPA